MKLASMGLLVITALLVGCAGKKHVQTKLPLKPKDNIEFRGVHDGHCQVADVFRDAKGGYVVVCK